MQNLLKNLLKPIIDSFLVDNNIEHKEEKSVNKSVDRTISQNKYKYVFLNNKCLRHSVNRNQSKNYKKGKYEISKVSLSCFDDKIYIQNNGYNGLVLGYHS